ncbi:MAG: polyprenyl diphosphate synthase [Eubacteriales bacterium]|nr:polyprenyl diphosphate synthase [Eubacteriales bacterium]
MAGEKGLPQHLAFIMDGNGRWAQERGLARSAGHRAGAERLREVCYWVMAYGIRHMSVYAFSTENWRRSRQEIQGLMRLIPEFFQRYGDELRDQGAQIHFVGDLDELSPPTRKIIERMEANPPAQARLDLYICLNYGGRRELVRAVQKALRSPDPLALAERLNEENFRDFLYEPAMPDPDLIVRTAGEQRLSNFWLWQAAYAEFFFSPSYWPDFDQIDLAQALESFGQRQRRYGGAKG